LVGEWSGFYSSVETGRRGSILFTLKASQDTAFGDVLMIPNREDFGPTAPRPFADPSRENSHVLQINFVRCEGTAVTGWMNPYRDPDTGDTTYTTFTGTINNDELVGTFVAVGEATGNRLTGTWKVKRQSSRR
jgi:hypothetical protein